MKLRLNDEIIVTAGQDKGKRGKISQVWPDRHQVTVGGVNVYRRHRKKTADAKGQIVELTKPIASSNVALVCPKCQQKSRVGWSKMSDKKMRICKKCQEVF